MREAQKMMQDPNFQAQMKKMLSQGGMQQALQQTKQDLSDPKKAKELEEKARKAVEEGEKELAKLEEQKKKGLRVEKGGEDKEEDADKTLEVDNDSKPPAALKTEEEDDMPDIPVLSLN